jgi:hypothetical protein
VNGHRQLHTLAPTKKPQVARTSKPQVAGLDTPYQTRLRSNYLEIRSPNSHLDVYALRCYRLSWVKGCLRWIPSR